MTRKSELAVGGTKPQSLLECGQTINHRRIRGAKDRVNNVGAGATRCAERLP
jgi:hypothetical protein